MEAYSGKYLLVVYPEPVTDVRRACHRMPQRRSVDLRRIRGHSAVNGHLPLAVREILLHDVMQKPCEIAALLVRTESLREVVACLGDVHAVGEALFRKTLLYEFLVFVEFLVSAQTELPPH